MKNHKKCSSFQYTNMQVFGFLSIFFFGCRSGVNHAKILQNLAVNLAKLLQGNSYEILPENFARLLHYLARFL